MINDRTKREEFQRAKDGDTDYRRVTWKEVVEAAQTLKAFAAMPNEDIYKILCQNNADGFILIGDQLDKKDKVMCVSLCSPKFMTNSLIQLVHTLEKNAKRKRQEGVVLR